MEMNAQATKLQAVENDLKQLMADVTQAMEKAQEVVARIASTTPTATTETKSRNFVVTIMIRDGFGRPRAWCGIARLGRCAGALFLERTAGRIGPLPAIKASAVAVRMVTKGVRRSPQLRFRMRRDL